MGERKGAGFRPNISYIVIQCLFSIFISLRQFFFLSTYFLRCNGHLGGFSLCPLLIKMHRLDAHVRSIHRRHLFSCLDQTRRVCLVWLTFFGFHFETSFSQMYTTHSWFSLSPSIIYPSCHSICHQDKDVRVSIAYGA